MTDVKVAVARLRILAEDETPPDGCRVLMRGDIRAVLGHLEAAEHERDMAQGELQCQVAANEQIRERLEAAERLLAAHQGGVNLGPGTYDIGPTGIRKVGGRNDV